MKNNYQTDSPAINLDDADFIRVEYSDGGALYFDKDYKFHEQFGHNKRKTRQFPYHKDLLQFVKDYPDRSLYFTWDDWVKPFKKIDQGFLINMNAYCVFCAAIGSKTNGRAKAFLSHEMSINDIATSDAERDEYVKRNANEKNIIDAINNLDKGARERVIEFVRTLEGIQPKGNPSTEMNYEEFIKALSKFLTSQETQLTFYSNLPKIQLAILNAHRDFLFSNLDKNEVFIQNWLDEDGGKYRKQRCLIFGLEYVDPKREGALSGKRFDILAEQNLDNHVLIELKSPSAQIFDIKTKATHNDGIITEYHLSPELSRAIPQILGYKKWYDGASAEEIQALGIVKRQISKCIIVIGTRNDDPVWKENFHDLKNSLKIELLTYSDLLDRLDNTIKNLESTL